MIVLRYVRYRGKRCRELYSKDGQTWYLDRKCEVVANPKYITEA